jgi:hypothetical protein
VISLFADIAMAIEGDFDRYTSIVLGILKQAGEVNIEDVDEDLVDYINSLRVSILEAYTGIIQGLKEAKKQDSMVPALDSIVELLARSTTDPQVRIKVGVTFPQSPLFSLIINLSTMYGFLYICRVDFVTPML